MEHSPHRRRIRPWGHLEQLALVVGDCDDPNAQIFTIAMLLLVSAFNCVVTATMPLAAYAASVPISCATLWIFGVHSLGDGSAATLAFVFVGAAQLFFVPAGAAFSSGLLRERPLSKRKERAHRRA